MLGYVKPLPQEMLVKHHSLYRAAYCGLCRSVKKNSTRFMLPFFSDDWVFLSVLRMAVSGEEVKTEKDFCFLHPFRRDHRRLADCPSLKFSALSSLVFTYEKMKDELQDRDSSFGRRILIKLLSPRLKKSMEKHCKKDPDFLNFSQEISRLLEQGKELEKQKSDLDTMCSNFAACLSYAFSYGFDGENKRLLSGIGDCIGRFLYTLDAMDDLENNEKSGSFNPILNRYTSVTEAKEHFPELDLVLSFYIQEAKLDLDLLSGEKNMLSVCENIICHGLPGAVRRILKPKMGESNERSL